MNWLYKEKEPGRKWNKEKVERAPPQFQNPPGLSVVRSVNFDLQCAVHNNNPFTLFCCIHSTLCLVHLVPCVRTSSQLCTQQPRKKERKKTVEFEPNGPLKTNQIDFLLLLLLPFFFEKKEPQKVCSCVQYKVVSSSSPSYCLESLSPPRLGPCTEL